MTKQIIDNDGFLALIDSSTYNSFVTKDWELDELFRHFSNQMNQGSFLIWRTGYEGGTWNVNFTNQQSNEESFREFNAIIEVTDRKLYLAEYADLTMAASYPEQKIPSQHNSDLYYELENGVYSVTIRQLFNPELDDEIDHKLNFEIILKPTNAEDSIPNQIEKIQWYE